jgi:hypothetical protein
MPDVQVERWLIENCFHPESAQGRFETALVAAAKKFVQIMIGCENEEIFNRCKINKLPMALYTGVSDRSCSTASTAATICWCLLVPLKEIKEFKIIATRADLLT